MSNNTKTLKTPITYYGGKQRMLRHILPLIPEHKVYTEAFCGGAAVFFAKQPAVLEVINDLNGELINFYQVLKNRLAELRPRVMSTLHSRKLHRQAWLIYNQPEQHDEVTRAWALWVMSSQGFSGKLESSWGYDKSRSTMSTKVRNAKARFEPEAYAERLELVQVECNDALKVIASRDTVNTFHYIDPPYFNSDCAHYSGYTADDMEQLLQLVGKLEGKFLLSSYPSDLLDRYVKINGWYQKKVKQAIAVSKHAAGTKTEVLTANYPI